MKLSCVKQIPLSSYTLNPARFPRTEGHLVMFQSTTLQGQAGIEQELKVNQKLKLNSTSLYFIGHRWWVSNLYMYKFHLFHILPHYLALYMFYFLAMTAFGGTLTCVHQHYDVTDTWAMRSNFSGLMTPGLSKDIWCHICQYSLLCLQITRSDIRLHMKWAVSLVICR